MPDDDPTQDVALRRRRLTAWRNDRLADGVSPGRLPSERDLGLIAAKGVTAHVPFDNHPAVRHYRDALRIAAEGRPDGAPDQPEPVAVTTGSPYVAEAAMTAGPERNGTSPHLPDANGNGNGDGNGNGNGNGNGIGSGDGTEEPGGFARYVHGFAVGADPQPGPLSVAVDEQGTLHYAWKKPVANGRPASVRWYRVLTRDDRMPFSPDDRKALLVVTQETEAVDPRPLQRAQRHVQVWLNEGGDQASARGARARLVFQTTVVAPPAGAGLQQDGTQVTGEWQVADEVSRVDVYRLPADRANAPSDPEYLLRTGGSNRDGVVDRDCPPGAWLYRLYAVLDTPAGELTSPPVIIPQDVEAPLRAVDDLRLVTDPARPGTVDLEWSAPPGGEVHVYRTEKAPAPGTRSDEIPLDRFNENTELEAKDRLRRAIEKSGRARRMADVPIPPGAGRLYFTPVTVLGDRTWVGTPVTHVRVGPVTEPQLFQRVDWQLVSFGWPEGATKVHVHVTPRGEPVRAPLNAPVASVDWEDYRLQGGIVLQGVLPPFPPCDVHLTPIISGKVSHPGPTATIQYPGLIRIEYRLLRRRTTLGRERQLELCCNSDVKYPLRFVAVHHPQRLPLSLHDGEEIAQWSTAFQRDAWMPLGPVDPKSKGYVRIFVDFPDAPVDIAVIDPGLDLLRWG